MDPLVFGVSVQDQGLYRWHRLVVAPIDVRQGWNATWRVTLQVLGASIQELAVQALELLAARWSNLKIAGRDGPLTQVARETIDLRKSTLLSRYLVVYPEAVGRVLVI